MTPLQKYELTIRSTVLRGEKPTKGLEATEAPTPHQMNRVTGFMPDGTKVVVAQRPGKGGMDFNKLLGGKVYAVAADGVSPVYEKDAAGKATKVQKQEDGLPLYSSSGFYLMSSKDYPALEIIEAYTLLRDKGNLVWLLTEQDLAGRQKHNMTSDLDLDLTLLAIKAALSDDANMVAKFDAGINKKRESVIRRAKEDAEAGLDDGGDPYAGADFVPLAVSKKDGNPFVLFCWTADGAEPKMGAVSRELEVQEEGRPVTKYLTVDEAMAQFATTPASRDITAALEAGKTVDLSFARGHIMRTSVSFRRKVENVLATPDKPAFGDAVYIHAALKGWTKGLLSLMHSLHPTFPLADYDAHHYVAACRQAEIGMNKKDGKWTPPAGLHYKLSTALMA
jgi:hypothetical protein